MVMRKMTALLTFVLIICLLPAAAFAKTFKEGDKDWKIMVTQQKLKTLGYATDRTDGKFSKATADSLKNFQKKHKLKANGRLDDKTYKKVTWEAFKKEGITNVKGRDVVKRLLNIKVLLINLEGQRLKALTARPMCSMFLASTGRSCRVLRMCRS